MAGLVPAIHVARPGRLFAESPALCPDDVDARVEPAHDGFCTCDRPDLFRVGLYQRKSSVTRPKSGSSRSDAQTR